MKTIKYTTRVRYVADLTTTVSDSEYDEILREHGENNVCDHIIESINDGAIMLPAVEDPRWDLDDVDVDGYVIVSETPPVAVDEHGFHEETP